VVYWPGNPQQPMNATEDDPYKEIGESIAGAVLEGAKSKQWAVEMTKLLGYTTSDLSDWLVRYNRENYQRLRWQRNKSQRRQKKIDMMNRQAADLLRSQHDDA